MGYRCWFVEVRDKQECAQVFEWAQNVEHDQQCDWGIRCACGVTTTADLNAGELDAAGKRHSYIVVESDGSGCMDHICEYVDDAKCVLLDSVLSDLKIEHESGSIEIIGQEIVELSALLDALPDRGVPPGDDYRGLADMEPVGRA